MCGSNQKEKLERKIKKLNNSCVIKFLFYIYIMIKQTDMKTTKRFAGEYVITKDNISYSASYQYIRKEWLVQPINDEYHECAYCDTLKTCKEYVTNGFFNN